MPRHPTTLPPRGYGVVRLWDGRYLPVRVPLDADYWPDAEEPAKHLTAIGKPRTRYGDAVRRCQAVASMPTPRERYEANE